jgi:hypothetical protein
MRKSLLTLLVGTLVAATSGFASPQAPGAEAKAAAQKGGPPGGPPDCLVETILLGGLKEGAALANTLGSVFQSVVVRPDTKDSTRLYAIDRVAARQPQGCKAKGWRSQISRDDLDQVVQLLDRDIFQGVGLNSNFVIRLYEWPVRGAPRPIRLQHRPTEGEIEVRIVDSFSHPTSDLELVKTANGLYCIFSPTSDIPAQAAAKQVARIRHDLELLDEQYRLAYDERNHHENLSEDPATTLGTSLARAFNPDCTPSQPDCFQPLEKQAEAWLARHTVKLLILDPRDAFLNLRDFFSDLGRQISVRAGDQAITILPLQASLDSPAYVAADAIEQSTLYHVEGDSGSAGAQDGAPKQSGADSSASVSSSAPSSQSWTADNVVRLYHLREATKIAGAINAAAGKGQTLVTPINEDLLLILPQASGQTGQSAAIRRAIAIMDLPRPKVSLQVWSYQVSANAKGNDSGAADVQEDYLAVKDAVDRANTVMTRAVQAGLGAVLDDMRKSGPSYFDADFHHYLTDRYDFCVKAGYYCLGYETALLVPPEDAPDYKDVTRSVDHSLSRFLLLLAAANDTQVRRTIGHMLAAMQESIRTDTEAGTEAGKHPCGRKRGSEPKEATPCENPQSFARFSKQLDVFSRASNLHIMRAAVLDFLYYYKWANVYPNDFSPYDLQRSAHVLDSLLSPLTDAFNQDVDASVQDTLEQVQKCKGKNCVVSFGQVEVVTVSGTQASVVGQVKNYFDITPPVTLADMLNPNSTTSQGLASTLKGVLEPKTITILSALANANSQPRITAEVSKDTTLTITPTSLDTASSADLNLDFEVKDDAAPESVNASAQRKDLLDRVADHHVNTRVRVDSLRLFQISAFTMELTHPQPPKCVWNPFCAAWGAIFGSVPGLRHVGEYRREPKTIDNRSVAIVRAVIVPTAMDLGLGLRFERDRIVDPVTNTAVALNSSAQIGGRIQPFHKEFIHCMAQAADGAHSCLSQRKLSSIPEEAH